MKKGKYQFFPNGAKCDAVAPEAEPGRKAGNHFIDDIIKIGNSIKSLAKTNAPVMHQMVLSLIKNKSQNSNEIGRTLDYLMDWMMWGECEDDFKELLKYYKTVDKDGADYYRKSAIEEKYFTDKEI